jgi:cytochrome c-type biogenesis protein CcsB
MYPDFWAEEKLIAVPAVLQERLKLKKHVSATDLVASNGNFKWLAIYQTAFQKSESKRDEFDKKIIKLNEKFEVTNSIFAWQYMRIIPKKNDANNSWYIPMEMSLMEVDSLSSLETLKYLSFIDEASKTGQYSKASTQLKKIKEFQRKIGANVVPSESRVKLEISYNKMQIFLNTWRVYLSVGFLMLILFYISVFTKIDSRLTKILAIVRKVFVFILIVFFVYHGVGLGFRWYISEHAPWSNGYEAVIFIAWITMIAGFLFSRKNEVVLPGTVILAALMIFVTEMNLLDPEITPLVPVLKSYWLMIHVAIITGSYGFLGLACVLGLLNLILYLFRRKSNGEIVTRNITELTYISEMTMTIGVFMLTIGTFLGGIWANESWGRYWGWDPKETWALVSVLVYAVILHFRYIPAMKSKFIFNVASFWGYSAILFTFFGVNFMLVGLHSYAQGDGLGKMPNWVIVSIGFFLLLTIIASIRNKSYNKSSSKSLHIES